MGFHHDIDGVGAGSDYIQLDYSYDPRPGSWFQVFIIDYMDTVSLWTLLIWAVLLLENDDIFKNRSRMAHQRNLNGTNTNDLQLYISMSNINFNQELGHLKFSPFWKKQYALPPEYMLQCKQ